MGSVLAHNAAPGDDGLGEGSGYIAPRDCAQERVEATFFFGPSRPCGIPVAEVGAWRRVDEVFEGRVIKSKLPIGSIGEGSDNRRLLEGD